VPAGLDVTAAGGKLVGKDWEFDNLTGNRQFDKVVYINPMQITWKVERITKPTDFVKGGTSRNPTYVTFEAVKRTNTDPKLNAPATFKMLRSFVHIGVTAVQATTPLTKDDITLAIWNNAFKPLTISTWDNKKLVYYKTWDYKNVFTQPQYTTSGGLLTSLNGECLSFTRLLVDVLRAQGIENKDDLYAMAPLKRDVTEKATGQVFRNAQEDMFIKEWVNVATGSEFFNGYKWTDTSQEGNELWWGSLAGGGADDYEYKWSNAFKEVTKTRDKIPAQNNKNPQAMFVNHIVVQLTINGSTKLYDPCYGAVYDSRQDFETKAIAYYGFHIYNATLSGTRYKVSYYIRANPSDDDLKRLTSFANPRGGSLDLKDY
jgi:hypothetical protein